jgi:hypothetical protein
MPMWKKIAIVVVAWVVSVLVYVVREPKENRA